jgi:hypothetical protein
MKVCVLSTSETYLVFDEATVYSPVHPVVDKPLGPDLQRSHGRLVRLRRLVLPWHLGVTLQRLDESALSAIF